VEVRVTHHSANPSLRTSDGIYNHNTYCEPVLSTSNGDAEPMGVKRQFAGVIT
jgi:hypothetical protein